MRVEIKKRLINKIIRTFKKRVRIFKIGVMIGRRLKNKVIIEDFIYPKQTLKEKGNVAEISSDEYSSIINKYGKKAIGFIFYMRSNEEACDTDINSKMRERGAMFGLIDLSLVITAKDKHSFYSNENLDIKMK